MAVPAYVKAFTDVALLCQLHLDFAGAYVVAEKQQQQQNNFTLMSIVLSYRISQSRYQQFRASCELHQRAFITSRA